MLQPTIYIPSRLTKLLGTPAWDRGKARQTPNAAVTVVARRASCCCAGATTGTAAAAGA